MYKNNARYNRNYRNNNRIPRRNTNNLKNPRNKNVNKLVFRKLPYGFINNLIRANYPPIYKRKNNNGIRNRNNKIQNKDIKEVKNFLIPKVTNINKSKKEPRRDLIITPMQMALDSKIMSIYSTSNRITYMPIYTKVYLDSRTANDKYLMWFPYCVAFNNYNNNTVRIDSLNTNVLTSKISNLISIITNMDGTINTAKPIQCGVCGILGMYRLIGATMKITNLTSPMNKCGSYSVYRLTESEGYPCYYSDDKFPDKNNSPRYFATINKIAIENHDQVSVKQTYASNDICHINEFNLTQGNTIFSKADEYLGGSFITSEQCSADWGQNPDGVNIKYLIHIPPASSINNYMIETWSIIELIPDPITHLDNLAKLQTRDQVMSKKRIEAMKHMNPLSKSN